MKNRSVLSGSTAGFINCWDLGPQWLGAVDRSDGSEIRKFSYDTANPRIRAFPKTGFLRAV